MAITIYAISCSNGRIYVGSTKGKLGKRFREHRCLLNQGKHKTKSLQSDWTALGEHGNFMCFALSVLPTDDLSERRRAEIDHMDYFAAKGLLYNEHRVSMRPTDEAIKRGVANAHRDPGNRWTPEVNERRRQAQLGKPKGHGAKISATKRAKREQVMR